MHCVLYTLDEVDELVADAGGVVAAVLDPAAEVVTDVSSVGGSKISEDYSSSLSLSSLSPEEVGELGIAWP